ncbi:flagellar export chaperone FliS [Paenibacillus sp. LMG 31459]|uniref:Flagellar secretion chaperone FliS n=1 Tax=Paenibacillus phytohabitans TaxID=2654978 RepID=A0ABX1YFI7_9BACL|nr:flagellar export chaperone FliS [Paenibacillus phytohabitans]NOU79244.1 flagellar export chaperone FliS [Paenibacillus phytohabitans]
MITSPHQKYQQTQLHTASPAQLLLMLYDGAIRFSRVGISAIQEKNYEKANINLCKAQAVIHELIAALNYDYPIAKTLYQVYEYMIHQLINANMKKITSPADEVVSYLLELREAWDAANKSLNTAAEQSK